MLDRLGVQLYTIRDQFQNADDMRKAFARLREIGYTCAQTASTFPFPCSSMEEYVSIANEYGIKIVGTHTSFEELEKDTDLAIAQHASLGCKFVGIGGFGWGITDAKEIYAYCDRVNRIAEKLGKAGMRFTYHHHSHEFIRLDNGERFIDILERELDPKNTSFCVDTYWAQNAGADVCAFLRRLEGRVDVLHLKDMDFGADGSFYTEVGNGNMNFDAIIKTAEQIGVKWYIVEQDTCPGDPFESLKMSYDNLVKKYE